MLTSTASTTQGDRPDTLSQNQPPEPTFGFSRQKPQNSQRKSSRTLEASSSQLSDSKPKKTEPRKEIIDLTQLSDGNDSYSDSAKEQSDQGERDLKNNPPVLLPDSGSNHLEQEQVSHTGDIAQSYQEQSEVNYSSSKLQTSHQEPTQVEARSSSPESILETAVPQALCEPKTPAEETSLQQIPSTVPLLEDSSHLKTSQYNFECDRGKLQDNFTTTDVDTEQLNGNVRNVEKGLIDQSANFDETTSLGKSMPSTKIIVSKSWGVSTNDTSIKLDRKRKFPEPAIPSSNTWKRRRHQRRPLGLDFSQGTADMRDPSIMARKYREEFLASRKNSLSESYDSPSRMSSVNGTPDRKLDLRANPILSLTSKDQPDFTLESTGVQEFQHLPEKKHANKALLSAHEEYTVAADTTAKAPERPRSETRETDLDAVSQKLQVFSSAQESQNITKATYEPTVGGVQAQSLTELMTPALSITDGEPVQSFEPFFGMQASRSPLPSSSIFEQFRTTYPEYAGTFSHFVGICKKIKSLHEADRMEHRALWDDFIVRHNTEYPQYLRRCAEAVEDCLPYEKYYRCEIEEPIYKNHIVTPTSLSQILASESSPYTSGSLTRSETPLHSKADIGPPLQQKPNQAEVRIKETPLQQRKESPDAVFQRLEERRRRRSHLNSPMVGGATTASFQKQEASPPPVERRLDVKNEQAAETINLTEDDVLVPESSPCGTVESPTLSPKKSSRTLPWVSSGDTITPTRRDPLSKVNSMIAPKIKHNDLKSPVNSSRATNSAPSKLCNVTLKPGMRDTSLPRTSSLCRSKRAIESSSKKRIEVQRSTPIIEMQLVESRGIDDWWKDENSPFNIFRRKYMAITPGKGNSYAQDHEREMGNRRQRDGR